jgi:DNA-binding phage protein
MTEQEITRLLRKAGQKTKNIDRMRRDAAIDLGDAVLVAKESAWGPTRIAEVAGVSRQTVHKILKKER